MNLLLKSLACSALLGAAALTGCTTSSTASTTSELTGSIDQSTFPAAVAAITIARNDGTTTTAPVLDDGSFSALLESGGTYRLLLSADGTSTPVVLDASGGRLRTEIQVKTAGGSIDIGTIQYWDPTPGSASPGTDAQALETETTAPTTDATCVDGVLSGTRQACATTEAPVDCTAANDMSDGCPDMGDEASAALVLPTAAADLLAKDADAAEPMGLPALNAPAELTCAVAGGHEGGHHRRGH
ncbi:MAG: hypothetical protein ABI134_16960 [Byssovorax sp.]